LAVFRDNVYIGKSYLELTRPKETIKLSFGIDDKVGVTYRVVSDEKSQSGIIQKQKVVERRFRTEVTNHHRQALKISILDHVPVSQDERIEVELLPLTTPPSRKDPEERLGLLGTTRMDKYLPTG
jgi:uncharacterized protein (TIGR02231 family)